ncbi:MAG TPA: PAS domain S-box protein [Deltaproteobacteria bacterium]|nr:PAS domain S-box protein [Deltaproteobacteria bacterium]
MMNSGRHFSTHMVVTIVIMTTISILILSAALFFYFNNRLDTEFNEKLAAHTGTVELVLKRRLDHLNSRLRDLSHNNTIRVTMMLGVTSQLEEHIGNLYPEQRGVHFFVRCAVDEDIHPSLDVVLPPVILSHVGSGTSRAEVYYDQGGSRKLLWLLSMQVMRRTEQMGTAFCLYDMIQDQELWNEIRSKVHGTVFIRIPDGHIDLMTGAVASPQADNAAITKLKGFDNLFYLLPLDNLKLQKTKFLILIASVSTVVLVLSLAISIGLLGQMNLPLQEMTLKAIRISKGERDTLFDETGGYVEFTQLSRAFNIMLTKLSEAEEKSRYGELFENVDDAVYIVDGQGNILEANEEIYSQLGYTHDDFLQLNRTSFLPADDAAVLLDHGCRGRKITLETSHITAHGQIIPVEVSGKAISYRGNTVILNVARDITERKTAEGALRESEERFRTAFENAAVGMLLIRLDGSFMRINMYFCEMLGFSEGELRGKKTTDIIYSDDVAVSERHHQRLMSDHVSSVWLEHRFVHKSGDIVWGVVSSSLVHDINNRPLYIVSHVQDVTDRRRAEEEKRRLEHRLRRAQKMEALGTLAGGVAHDLNNVLSGTVTYPELLLMQLPEGSALRKPLLTIQKSGEKAAAIVQDLLTLARRGVATTEVVNLNDIISDYFKTPEFERLKYFHPHVEVELYLDDTLLNIMGSPVHLSKTVMNLVSNAAEAMPNGGTIVVSTGNCYIDRPVTGYDDVKEGDYVTMTILDHGIGISSNDLDRIFEPFYTKKVMGRSGTGLGMAVVWGTVKDHNGYINVTSIEDSGTVFTLYFPVTEERLSRIRTDLAVDDYRGRGQTVLVVDDIVEQREIATMMLSRLGYEVTSVSSGEKAIEYVKKNKVDLVLLDMIMDPGIDGLETYRRMLVVNPCQKAIIVSGFSENERAREAQQLGAGAYVRKPYLMESIGLAIKSELERKQGRLQCSSPQS